MKIATSNLERGGRTRAARLAQDDVVAALGADVIALTEPPPEFRTGPGIVASPAHRTNASGVESWVAIAGATVEPIAFDIPYERMAVAARASLGDTRVIVYGSVLPWLTIASHSPDMVRSGESAMEVFTRVLDARFATSARSVRRSANYAREHWTHPGENLPIGLILCAKKDAAVAKHALEGLDGETILIGAAARARATTHPELTALSFKRDMGTDRKIRLGDRTWTAMELSALVLGSLKRDAEAALGHSVRDVVVTVPAYFGELQRQHTRQAAEMAGLRAIRLLNEPTAAALVYGLVARADAHDVAVLDLGGGTFDVSILHIEDGDIAVRATAGDVRLGGDDFDAVLLQLVLERESKQLGELDRVTRARLLRACEGAKKRLTEHETAEVALVDAMLASGRGDFATSIDRASADRAFAPLLERMRGPIDRALRDAKTTMSAMDEVILVGGSTRMPAVRRLVADLFNRLPLATLPPDLAVAMGAAVQGELLESNSGASDAVLTDVAPFTLGVDSTTTLGRHRVSGIFAPIISRGTVLPASRTRSFSTIDDLQTSITFTVYQGEHARCPDNALLGTFEVKGLRPRPSGEETVELRFTYDANGLLEVDVVVVSTGATETHLVTSTTNKMSPEQLAHAREAMQKVKVRPREEMPNATAIARAEALFVDLVGSERDELGEALAMFRASLETEDAELITDMRARLVSLVGRAH